MTDVVIVSGVRTAIGKFQGALEPLSAPQLGSIVIREAVKRAKAAPEQVDECIMGLVVAAGLGQNPARQAALNGGLPPTVGAMTINKVCGSGLKSVALAAQAIQTGNAEMVVAGGMESMTNAPYLLPQARKGYRLGNSQIIDSVVNDGLWDIYNNYSPKASPWTRRQSTEKTNATPPSTSIPKPVVAAALTTTSGPKATM
jgi:acetyl-CoA C-acetyltransferase